MNKVLDVVEDIKQNITDNQYKNNYGISNGNKQN